MGRQPCVRHRRAMQFYRPDSGLTLVELMIAMAVGLFVVMAVTALFMSVRTTYLEQDDAAHIQETGRYVIDVIARAVRQASHERWNQDRASLADSEIGPDVLGLDARSLKAKTPGIDTPVAKAINGSDVLAIRFFGSGEGDRGDGTMLNCAGFGVAGPDEMNAVEDGRAWSIFYVAADSTGEPELYCKYSSGNSWASQAIARGVESFQVLYGLDTDMDGLPNRLLNASAINALDDELILTGVNAVERATERNRKTHWKNVVAVKVAVLIRGRHTSRGTGSDANHELFGETYSSIYAQDDAGVRISGAQLPQAVRGRMRKVFSTTIRLRNAPAGGGAAAA